MLINSNLLTFAKYPLWIIFSIPIILNSLGLFIVSYYTSAFINKNRENLTLSTVKRMYSFFSRHGNYRSTHYDFRDGEPTTWRIAWDVWGGDAGRTWSTNIWEKYKDK